MSTVVGRWTDLHNEPEVLALEKGQDFRLPCYRREVFLRFYEFHLMRRSHPGCVYYALPWLAKHFNLSTEQQLWLVFINGNTQNIVTSWVIFRRHPDFQRLSGPALKAFFEDNYSKLAWDTDRRYHRKMFLTVVERYAALTHRDQGSYFRTVIGNLGPRDAFNKLWAVMGKSFYSFGRLSVFSYSEYLRLVGVPVECSTLFLRNLAGSRSHRNGLCKVLGRDDLDWHSSNPEFDGRYTEEQMGWLAKGNTEPLNPRNTQGKFGGILTASHKHRDAGLAVEFLDRDAALARTLQLLGLT